MYLYPDISDWSASKAAKCRFLLYRLPIFVRDAQNGET